MKSKCCQYLQCPPDLAGFLSIFQVADEAHARSAGHRQLRLGKPQLSPSLFDETSKSLGGEGGFAFHSRSGIIDDSTGVSTCFIPDREYRVVSEMGQCYLFPLGKRLAFGPKRRDHFSSIKSGKEPALRLAPPLRTGLESFPSSGSSRAKAPTVRGRCPSLETQTKVRDSG